MHVSQLENRNMHCTRSGVVLFVTLLAVLVNQVICSDEFHADEGGKFAAFKTQTDFAEKELRNELNLKSDDEVHIMSVALQIKDGHMFNVTMCVKNSQSCWVIVHEQEGGKPLQVIKTGDSISTCVNLSADDTRHEVTPSPS